MVLSIICRHIIIFLYNALYLEHNKYTSKGLLIGFSVGDELFFTTGTDNTDNQVFTSSEVSSNFVNHLKQA